MNTMMAVGNFVQYIKNEKKQPLFQDITTFYSLW